MMWRPLRLLLLLGWMGWLPSFSSKTTKVFLGVTGFSSTTPRPRSRPRPAAGHRHAGLKSSMPRLAWSLSCSFQSPSVMTIATTTALTMGGYYSEPDNTVDQSQTHMVFGLRCRETTIQVWLNGPQGPCIVVRGLQPNEEFEYGQAMIDHLVVRRGNTALGDSGAIPNWSRCRLVEMGTSSTALAAHHGLNMASVTQLHPDPARINVIEYALSFLDNPPTVMRDCEWQANVLNPQEALPFDAISDADLIIITTADVLDRLGEAVHAMNSANKYCRIVVPSHLLSPAELQSYRYTEFDNGIVEIYGIN